MGDRAIQPHSSLDLLCSLMMRNVNSVAEQPEMKSKIEELRQMIKDGWQAALPP